MAHNIHAFIAPRAAFYGLDLECPAALVDLPQELALLPITSELWFWIHGGVDAGESRFRDVSLKRWGDAEYAFLRRLARGATAAYIDTDYFGGAGEQAAVAARDGDVVFGPRQDDHGPINSALRILGVRKEKDLDEFDTLGLGLFRDNGKLVRAYYLRHWRRAYYVLSESAIGGLESAARRQMFLRGELGAGGLYSCPYLEPPENVVGSFLVEHAVATPSFKLSLEEHWMISSFYRMRRDVETEPARFMKLASSLFDQTNVQFVIWSAGEAGRLAPRLTGNADDRRHFAGFYPYDIPGAGPPEDLVEAFPDKIRELRDALAATLPGTIGVLVNL